jgi:molybdate transport system regulatory protein
MKRNKVFAHGKIWLTDTDGESIFGHGKYRLLTAIGTCGSIAEAAKKLSMSYRKAWGDVKVAEDGFGFPLLIRVRGGARGGKTELTDDAVELLRWYETFDAAVQKDLLRHFSVFMKQFGTRGKA